MVSLRNRAWTSGSERHLRPSWPSSIIYALACVKRGRSRRLLKSKATPSWWRMKLMSVHEDRERIAPAAVRECVIVKANLAAAFPSLYHQLSIANFFHGAPAGIATRALSGGLGREGSVSALREGSVSAVLVIYCPFQNFIETNGASLDYSIYLPPVSLASGISWLLRPYAVVPLRFA